MSRTKGIIDNIIAGVAVNIIALILFGLGTWVGGFGKTVWRNISTRQIRVLINLDCRIIVGDDDAITCEKTETTGQYHIKFKKRFKKLPHIQLTTGDPNQPPNDWDNVANFHSISQEDFYIQVWDIGEAENTRDESAISITVTEIE